MTDSEDVFDYELSENQLAVNADVLNDGDDDEKFEMSPEKATASALAPKIFNRKKLLIFIMGGFSLIVVSALIINTVNNSKKNNTAADMEYQNTAASSASFLNSLQERALRSQQQAQREQPEVQSGLQPVSEDEEEPLPPSLLPAVTIERQQPDRPPAPVPPQQQPPPAPQSGPQQQPTHFQSSLVPRAQGSLFSQSQTNQAAPARTRQEEYLDYLNSQIASYSNPQNTAAQFSDFPAQNIANNSATYSGQFLSDYSIWTGTVITGILQTGINTDLPGNVIARVTQNVFDSRTGQKLLIPQGSLLIARYNNSISYAQRRIQIVWDTLIRTDGFQIELDGSPGIDRTGMAGQAAQYRENWFEYAKALGIIILFSYANAKMAETAAEFASDDAASEIMSANSAFVNTLADNFISRAMNIQPTLTVDNGTIINIMLNKTLYLPPVETLPAAQKYILE